MSIIEVEDYIYHRTYATEEDKPADKLKVCTVQGQWKEVERLYSSHPELCTVNIHKSIGTALHVAVNDYQNYTVVKNLVDSIIIRHKNEKALECKNEKGETPLHLAASRGFKIYVRECIIGQNGERKYLIDIDNNNGESPLFLAVLFWRKQTCVYLFDFKQHVDDDDYAYCKDLIRNNGDSILHSAIRKEYFGN